MKNKIVGMLVCMLLIAAAVLPVAGNITKKEYADEQSQQVSTGENGRYEKDEAIVGFYGPLPYFYQNIANKIASKYGLSIKDKNDNLCSVLYSNVDNQTFSRLQHDEDIKYVHRNFIDEHAMIPNDPGWSSQWGPQRIDAPNAWDITTGSSTVLVAVTDTGIEYTHSDLSGNYQAGGYDWVNNDNDPMDDRYHGTHCAGILGAIGDNSIGIAGMNWNVKMLAEKILDSSGLGTHSNMAKGWIDSVLKGADIISYSGGGSDSTTKEQAVLFAYNQGVLCVAASGNNYGGSIIYPAAYPEVIAVGAIDSSDDLASYSNVGPEQELVAPGSDINSTWIGNDYNSISGTSMACPHVSGVAALMMAINPDLDSEEIRCILQETAEDIGLTGNEQGYGLVNASEAVAAAEFRYSISVTPNSQIISVPGSVSYTVNVNLIQGTPQTVTLDLDSYYPAAPYTYSFSPSSGTPPFTSTLTVGATASQLAKFLRVVGSSDYVGCGIIRHSNYITVSTDPVPSDDLIWIKTSSTDDGITLNPRNGNVWTSPWIWSDPDPPIIGETNELWVRVGNLDPDTDSGPVIVKPYFNEYPWSIPIEDFPSLPEQTISNIPAGSYVDVSWDDWLIPEGWPEHFCVFAQAWRPGFEDFDSTFDIQGNNNIGQRNFQGVYTSSPYRSTFKFNNPTDKPMKITVYMKPPNTDWTVDLCMPSFDRNGLVMTPLIIPPNTEKELEFIIIPEEQEPEGQVDVWYLIEDYEVLYPDLFRYTLDVRKNNPPREPEIEGPERGDIKTDHVYMFVSHDPDKHYIKYFVDWGDGKNESTGYHPSGKYANLSHRWEKKGTYAIRVKAIDPWEAESGWTTYQVTMPKNKPFFFNFPLLNWLVERFPNAFPLLRQFLG
jgi:subtilisin family serine protease